MTEDTSSDNGWVVFSLSELHPSADVALDNARAIGTANQHVLPF